MKLPQVTTDDVTQTVDYRQAIQTVQDLNQSRNFQLIEVFAYALGQALLDAFERVLEVDVRVIKHPVFPVGVHLTHVSVEVCCQRGSGPGPTSD